MAKKAVATFKSDRSAKKNIVKCIRMVKSERTGAYAFEEGFVNNEGVKDFFAKK